MENLPPIVQQLLWIAIIALAMVFGNALYKRRHK